MRNSKWLAMAVSLALAMGTAPAIAATDYLLELDGVDGEAAAPKDHKEWIEVSSFSWGVSNPTHVGSSGMSAGKVAVQDLSVHATAPAPGSTSVARERGSGLATGKRTHEPVATTQPASDGRVAASNAPADGSVGQLTVRLRESPTKASLGRRMCVQGKHIAKATLRSATQSVELHDAVVNSCEVQGEEMKIVLTGTAKHTKSGHVTLLK